MLIFILLLAFPNNNDTLFLDSSSPFFRWREDHLSIHDPDDDGRVMDPIPQDVVLAADSTR